MDNSDSVIESGPIVLDARQLTMWANTRTAMVWATPAFTHIFYTMLDCRDASNKNIAFFTREVPIAATDGVRLFLNPDTFFKYTLHERVFIIAHEIMHAVLQHPALAQQLAKSGKVTFADGTSKPYDHQIMNVAMDYVINDMLVKSRTGDYNPNWLHDTSIGTAKDKVTEVYKRVYEDPDKGKGKGFDTVMGCGAAQQQKHAQSHSATAWKVAAAGAIATAKAQGALPAALERVLADLLDPKVDWTGKITGFLARHVGSGSYSWRKPDRRLIVRDIYSPGRSGKGANTIVVVGDTSGSMSDKEVAVIMAELRGIIEDINPARVIMLWADAIVQRVDYLESASDIHGLRPKGGGGTDFVPAFKWLEENGVEPDGMIYITDGYGRFPNTAPEYPVIWGDIAGHDRYPWGEVVHIPRDQINK